MAAFSVRRTTKGQPKTTHGQWRTPEYKVWAAMLKRCRATTGREHKNYSARGITVCDRWIRFENFIADMGKRPDGATLDRINNDGNYEPDNCRWATPLQNHRNRRNTRMVTIGGQTKHITEWARERGLSINTVTVRIHRGYTPEQALQVQHYKPGRRPHAASPDHVGS